MTSLAAIHILDQRRRPFEEPSQRPSVAAVEARREPLNPGVLAFMLIAYAASVRDRPAFTGLMKGPPVTDRIIRATLEVTGLTWVDLSSERRGRKVAYPRQAAWYLMRHCTGLSYPQIAHRLGKRDHSTVHYGIRAAEARIQEDGKFAGLVSRIAERAGLQESEPPGDRWP